MGFNFLLKQMLLQKSSQKNARGLFVVNGVLMPQSQLSRACTERNRTAVQPNLSAHSLSLRPTKYVTRASERALKARGLKRHSHTGASYKPGHTWYE